MKHWLIGLTLALALQGPMVISGEVAALPEVTPASEPVIEVSVPDTGRVIVNPYGLAIDLDGEEHREQIVSETYNIVNNSTVPVSVSASAAGSAPAESEAVFVTAPPPAEAPDKEVFVYLEFQNAPYGQPFWSGSYYGAPNQLLVTPQGGQSAQVLTLGLGERGLFRLFGSAAAAPEHPWRTEDRITITVAFTFSPAEAPVEG